jgi:hypothetical protein
MVAPACNPNYLGGKDQEDHNLRPAQQNIIETPSQPIKDGYAGVHVIPVIPEADTGELWSMSSQV